MGKVFIRTYGCTLNQSDSELIGGELLQGGHTIVGSEAEADTVIVNTCAVKETTENKILWYLGDLRKRGKRVVVSGCLPPVNLTGVKRAIPEALGYLGPNSISKIPALLEKWDGEKSGNGKLGIGAGISGSGSGTAIGNPNFNGGNGDSNNAIRNPPEIHLKDDFSSKFSLVSPHLGPVARIQTSSGCLSNCTFCATKIARGLFRSKPVPLILNEARLAIKNRAKEIQLTSQDNGCYGFDLHTTLPEVLRQLNELEGRFRIRVGMANPQHLLKNLDEWVEAFRLPKVYRFLHLPFQSGSNRILKEMLRGYSVEDAISVAAEFRNKIPSLTLETDMIVGFPGETEEEFMESLHVCSLLNFDVVNVSKFSKRKGTRAAKMRQLHSAVIKGRAERMDALVKKIALSQNGKCIGREYDVLILERGKNGFLQGRNKNYKPVLIKMASGNGGDNTAPAEGKLVVLEKNAEIGQFVRARIAGASVTSLIAE